MQPQPSAENNNLLLNLENAIKQYGKRVILNIEEFSLHSGDRVVLVGENGSGKSTLLRILSGIARLSKGNRLMTQNYQALCVAYVPQSGGLYAGLSVKEHFDLYAMLYDKKVIVETERNMLIEELGLDPFINYSVEQLSGGYQKAVALACALSVQPSGLYLDEPLAGLDAERRATLYSVLDRLQHQLQFLIMTGHELDNESIFNKKYRILKGSVQ